VERAAARRLAGGDERLKPVMPWQRLLHRPDLGAIGGVALVFAVFAAVAGNL